MSQFFTKILKKIINFLSRSRRSLIGGIVVAILLPVLLVSILIDILGIVQNPYFSFLIYLVIGPIFIIGFLMFLGGALFSDDKDNIGQLVVEYFEEELRRPGRFTRIRKIIFLTSLTTVGTLIVVFIVTFAGLQYTDTVGFCSQFCHKVMEPEYVTYKNSPHSQVSCVECHIGASSEWFTKSKFSGARQLLAVMRDSYNRPIKTPITALRPERGTCESCHRPEIFHGHKLCIHDKFLSDENNTHVQTVMLLKIGSGDYSGREAHDIHWHISENNKVTFITSKDREDIYQVSLVGSDQKKIVYRNNDHKLVREKELEERVMDCMDCHNRPTHIFLSPEESLDQKIINGVIPQKIPFIKRQGLAAIVKKYASQDVARRGIAQELLDWYREHYPDLINQERDLVDQAVRGVQEAYMENVFPQMNIEWGAYKSYTGHKNGSGCFRCHHENFKTDTGKTIPDNCDICHITLIEDQPVRDVAEFLKGLAK
ncbi:MAG: NapC/NirT family cytochrome c [Desulfobulbaceae bacterium]|nr:NapC/NirT family cytochrome c [Desulfobulbaceae bacterium]